MAFKKKSQSALFGGGYHGNEAQCALNYVIACMQSRLDYSYSIVINIVFFFLVCLFIYLFYCVFIFINVFVRVHLSESNIWRDFFFNLVKKKQQLHKNGSCIVKKDGILKRKIEFVCFISLYICTKTNDRIITTKF